MRPKPVGDPVGLDRKETLEVKDRLNITVAGRITLLHRDKLVLKNHSKFDTEFITVNRPTRLSSLIRRPEYVNAIFHWAACRVIFSEQGYKWNPGTRRWEYFDHSSRTWRPV